MKNQLLSLLLFAAVLTMSVSSCADITGAAPNDGEKNVDVLHETDFVVDVDKPLEDLVVNTEHKLIPMCDIYPDFCAY